MLGKNDDGYNFKLSKMTNMLGGLRKHHYSNAIHMVKQGRNDWIKQNSDSFWVKSSNRSYIYKISMLTAIQWARYLGGRRESAVMQGDCYYVSMIQALNNATNLADPKIAGGIRINRNSAILGQGNHHADIYQAYSCFSVMVNSSWFYIDLR